MEAVERKYLTEEDLESSWTPDLYFAKHKEAAESILVLDDMCQHGYKVPELTDGMTSAQTRAALVTVANFHAATVALQHKEGKNLQEEFPYLLSVDQSVESFNCLVERGLPLLLKFLESRKDQAQVREGLTRYSGPRAAQVLREVLAPSDKLNTLVHCDFWCNNLLFKEVEDAAARCCIIDWQMVMYGRPAIDVALLLTTSLEPAERRKHGSELLAAYWDAFMARLSKFGIESKALKYTKQDLEADFRAAQAMAALVVVGSVDIALGTPGREERVLNLLADLLEQGVL